MQEFFYLLVHSLKLVHSDKDIVIECKSKDIYLEAMKNAKLQFYEFYSFIQNYLDMYSLKIKYMIQMKPVVREKRTKKLKSKEPKITKLMKPSQYEVIEGFFINENSEEYGY